MKQYRSMLFVPGNRADWMDKAPRYKPDGSFWTWKMPSPLPKRTPPAPLYAPVSSNSQAWKHRDPPGTVQHIPTLSDQAPPGELRRNACPKTLRADSTTMAQTAAQL